MEKQTTRKPLRRVARLFLLGALLAATALVVRAVATGQVRQWQVSRMTDEQLSRAATASRADFVTVWAWAQRQERTGHWTEAARLYQRAAELRPTAVEAWVGWGRSAYAAGDWLSATAVLEKTLTLWPEQPEAHFTYAALLGNTSRLPAAREHLRQAVRGRPEWADAWAALADVELALKNPAGAAEAGQKALKLEPNARRVRVLLGAALVETEQWERARAELQAALNENPSDLEARFRLGQALVRSGDEKLRAEGLVELDRVSTFGSDKDRVWMELARVWISGDNVADATQALEHAYDSNPYNTEAVRQLVDLYRKQNRPGQVRRFAAELAALEKLEAERRELDDKISREEDVPDNLLRLSEVYLRQRRLVQARQALDAAARLGADKERAAAVSRRLPVLAPKPPAAPPAASTR